jgi:transcriptional regulator with XRE-family HTH domain
VDTIRVGLSLRALRIRRGWRQVDLASRAGISQSLVSAIERGGAGTVPLRTLAHIADVLDARIDLAVRWRGEQLDRLLDSAHARLVERTVEILVERGWDTRVETSFAIRGERGSIDLLARHPTGFVLVVEVKSVVPDSQAMLHSLDRKVRLAPEIVAGLNWTGPVSFGRLLIVADGSTGRRRIAALAATYGTVLPDRGARIREWLRRPEGPLAGLLFLPYIAGGGRGSVITGIERVRGPRRAEIRADSGSFKSP